MKKETTKNHKTPPLRQGAVSSSYSQSFKIHKGKHNSRLFTIEAKFMLTKKEIGEIIKSRLNGKDVTVSFNGKKYVVYFPYGLPLLPKMKNEIDCCLALAD